MATSTLYQSSPLASPAGSSRFCTFPTPRNTLFQPKADWRASFTNSNKESVRNLQSKPLILRHQNGTWFPKLNDNTANNLQQQTEIQSLQPSLSPSDTRLSLGRVPKTLRCHVCRATIREDHFQAHLFFGKVSCDLCDLVCETCRDFQQLKRSSDRDGSCQHIFVYIDDPCDYLLSRLSGSDDMCTGGSVTLPNRLRILQNYVNQLTSLHLQEPWCNAVRKCKSILIRAHTGTSLEPLKHLGLQKDSHTIDRGTLSDDFNNSYDSKDKNNGYSSNLGILQSLSCSNTPRQDLQEEQGKDEGVLLTQNYDLEHLEKEVEYVELEEQLRLGIAKGEANYLKNKKRRKLDHYKKLKAHTIRKKRYQYTTTSMNEIHENSLVKEDVALPEDGYYLMVRKPLEECPMCYECLSPSHCSVNLKTFLFTVNCSECGLIIYIVPDLPDGLQIVTDTNANENNSPKSTKHDDNTSRKVRPRDFFAK